MISGRGWPINLWVVLLSLTCASRVIADPIEPRSAVLASLKSPFIFASLQIAGADIDVGSNPQTTGHISPTGPSRLVITPPGPDDTQFVGVLSYPFRLSAALSGFAADGTAFHFNLRGQGTGSTIWIGFGSPEPGTYVESDLTFSPAAPTPEPTPLVLMGIGAAVTAFRRR